MASHDAAHAPQIDTIVNAILKYNFRCPKRCGLEAYEVQGKCMSRGSTEAMVISGTLNRLRREHLLEDATLFEIIKSIFEAITQEDILCRW